MRPTAQGKVIKLGKCHCQHSVSPKTPLACLLLLSSPTQCKRRLAPLKGSMSRPTDVLTGVQQTDRFAEKPKVQGSPFQGWRRGGLQSSTRTPPSVPPSFGVLTASSQRKPANSLFVEGKSSRRA